MRQLLRALPRGGDTREIRRLRFYREFVSLRQFSNATHIHIMTTIDDALLDGLLRQARASERLRMNFDLRNNADEDSQRMLNVMLPGTKVPIHRHTDTIETVIVLRGRVDEVFYDSEGNETRRVHLDATAGTYGLQIPAGVYHTVEALTPCAIFEMKAGKFAPRAAADTLGE